MASASSLVQFVDDAVDAGVGAGVAQMSSDCRSWSFSEYVAVVQFEMDSANCFMTETQAVEEHGGMMVTNRLLTDAYSEQSLVLAAAVYASVITWSSASVQSAALVSPTM